MASFSVALFAVSAIMLIAGGYLELSSRRPSFMAHGRTRVRTRDPNDEVE